ncbi:HIT family protein [Methanosphaerula subterraneus]|uniref:HIT family protein n=1 Tax=Methanosphaerula subterraneus TaxID=3350244 RepID=UPI003F831D81
MERMTGCPFCGPADEEVVLQGRLWYGRWDWYPVSPGHLLLIPGRHVAGPFEATDEEMAELPRLLQEAKAVIDGTFHPDDYNVGVNCGEAAGQTVMHLHVHLIPRYRGDMDKTRAGSLM